MQMDRDSIAREEIRRMEQRCRDIRAVLDDLDAGRRPMRAGLSLIADLALGEADRTVRIGAPHTPEVTT